MLLPERAQGGDITLSNSQVITILVGELTGSVTFPVQGDDVYADGETFNLSISSAVGGDYEQLVTTDIATVTVTDTINPVAITLNDPTVSEGGNVTITASVLSAPALARALRLAAAVQAELPLGQPDGPAQALPHA